MMMNQLHLNQVAFEQNYHYLFSKITYTITSGDILQIAGANGSGKSTLLRIMAGLLEPHEGSISWNNHCIFKHHHDYAKNLVYLGHLHAIRPLLTVEENLTLYQTLLGLKIKSIKHYIIKAGLEKYTHVLAQSLSAGQLKRLSLIKLMLQPKALWLLDEPMTTLDKQGLTLLNELLKNHLENQGITIIATHQPLTLAHPVKILNLEEFHV